MSTRKIELHDVAIIVATKNDSGTLSSCIDSLLTASKGDAEVMIVNDGSTDQTESILASYGEQIKVLEGLGEGPGKARNQGLKATDKHWIAFTDADCEVSKNWLTSLCEGLANQGEKVVGIGGPQKISQHANKTEREIGRFLETVGFVSDYIHDATEVFEVSHNPTCNVLYDRKALEAVDGFDENLWPCEDLDLDLRLRDQGYRLLFHPGADVEHRRPRTWTSFGFMMRRYGFAHAQLVKKRGLCQPLHFLPLLTLFALLLGGGAFWFFPFYSGIGLSLLVVGVFLFFLGLTRSISRSLVYPLLLLNVVGEWLIGFSRGLFGRRRIAGKNV